MSATNPLASPDAVSEKRPYEPSMEEILASIRRIIADDQSLPGRIPMPEPEAVVPADREAQPDVRPSVSVLRPHRVAAPEPNPEAASPVPHYSAEPQPQQVLGAGSAYGAVSAPQYAMPEGPATEPPATEPVHVVAPVELPKPAASEPEPTIAARHVPEPEPVQSSYVAEARPQAEGEPLYDTPIDPAPTDRDPPREAMDPAPLFSAATDSAVSSAFNMLAASRLADNSDELMTLAREMIRPLLRAWIDDNVPGMVERMVRAEIERVARGGR